MAELLAECVPQLLLIAVACSSAFGSSLIRTGSQQVAEFVQTGGGDAEATRVASSALATAVLAITSFVTTVFVVIMDSAFALSTAPRFGTFFLAALLLSAVALLIFLALIVSRQPHELALDRGVRILAWRDERRFRNSSPAQVVERMTILLMVVSLLVGGLKVVIQAGAGP